VFALWLTLSVLWAHNAGEANNGVQDWLTAILGFVVVLTTLRSTHDVTVIAVAFIAGAVVSVTYGVATGALSAAAAAAANEAALHGRFTGGGGDPNVQAAGYLVAMFVCAGLWSLARTNIARLSLIASFLIVSVGFFATQSRGGLLSLSFAALTGLVLLPRQRKRILGLAVVAGAGLAVIAVVNPAAIARMTDFGGGTSGRNDIWAVAWRIFTDHPLIGIGINNFQLVEPHYTLTSGALNRIELIAEVPHLVHNVYLQMLTETGVVGFLAFLAVVGGCLRASWRAARYFDAIGRVDYGDLARSVLMAGIAMLSALWILLGLGPVLLSLARRSQAAPAPAPAVRLNTQRQVRPRLSVAGPP
jgi:O-antigen ligase